MLAFGFTIEQLNMIVTPMVCVRWCSEIRILYLKLTNQCAISTG
jgi:hypothetical protein